MSSTRLLILGVLRQMQPAHGYRIRQRLESWQVDEWANVAFGSIYFALGKMAKDGLIAAVNSNAITQRTEYVVTDEGEAEYQRLLREQWTIRKPIVEPFRAALAFMSDVPPCELVQLLRDRIESARGDLETLETMSNLVDVSPRHVRELLLLAAAHAHAEIAWAESAVEKVIRGALP